MELEVFDLNKQGPPVTEAEFKRLYDFTIALALSGQAQASNARPRPKRRLRPRRRPQRL